MQNNLEKFDQWRKSKGFSQQDVADKIGWDRSKVNRVLQGKQGPDFFLSRVELAYGDVLAEVKEVNVIRNDQEVRSDNYRWIKRYDTEASGGSGTLTTEEDGETIQVITEWLPKLPDQNLAFITVIGDSMSPLMGSGDTPLLI